MEAPIRVVVADDHPVVRRGLRALLDSIDGFEVVGEAEDGESAVRETQLTRPDVVLMDVQMPRMDGLQATQQIRAELPAAAQPRIIALTANALAEDRRACLEAGMDAYLAKPVRAAELATALERTRTPALRRAGDLVRAAEPAALALVADPDRSGPSSEPGSGDLGPEESDPAVAGIVRRLVEIAGPDPEEDRELFTQLLTTFLGRLPEEVDRLVDALDGTDAELTMLRAHGLKGSASNLGADALATICAEVEAGGRRSPAVFPTGAQQRLREVSQATSAALGQVVEQLQDPPGLTG